MPLSFPKIPKTSKYLRDYWRSWPEQIGSRFGTVDTCDAELDSAVGVATRTVAYATLGWVFVALLQERLIFEKSIRIYFVPFSKINTYRN